MALVSVTKMSGESCEMQASSEDTVRELAEVVARELQVPSLAQKRLEDHGRSMIEDARSDCCNR